MLTPRRHACTHSLQVITSFSKQQGRVTSPWVEVGGVQWRLKVGVGPGVGKQPCKAGANFAAGSTRRDCSVASFPVHLPPALHLRLSSRGGVAQEDAA